MRRSPSVLLLLVLLASLAPQAATAPAPVADDQPKTIILGFDGMDHELTQRFMDEGLLPHLSSLRDSGTFQRLETSNPAQSPVSWGVFNTGQNPGKTGVAGFVARTIARAPNAETGVVEPVGAPMPIPNLGSPTSIVIGDEGAGEASAPAPASSSRSSMPVAWGVGGLLVAFIVLRFLFKLPALVALLLGVGAAGGLSWYAGQGGMSLGGGAGGSTKITGKVPYEINPMQGTNWWTYLDDAGVRVMGIQVAATFPPDEEGPNTKLLSGLGVKDISGSPGSWKVYTDDPWAYDKGTNSGGRLIKIFFDEKSSESVENADQARVNLEGPKNWLVRRDHEDRIAGLEAQLAVEGLADAPRAELQQQLDDAKAEFSKWQRRNGNTTAEVTVVADRVAGKATFDVQGEVFTLDVGGWSDFVRTEFVMDPERGYSEWGIARFHLISCDDEEVRFFVPPVNIDPYEPADHMPISAPPAFSRELAEGIGRAYETLGWACMTNPLKDNADSGFEAQSFMDDIANTMHGRELIMDWAFQRPDEWDVYYQVYSTTDRIGHMLYREFDPEHPAYDPEYANTMVSAWGRQFPLKEALPEVYMQADRIVGGVLEKIEAGEFGDDVMLMLVADHGFTSFRRQVNLNNLLHELGYLVFKDGAKSVDELTRKDFLAFVDWDKTQAYSMGLGKVFINKVGREANGIVGDDEYDDVVGRIIADLEAVTDVDGTKVVTSAQRRDELFDGPWVRENYDGSLTQKVKGERRPVEQWDGFADIFLGYAPYYRVSWSNTMGGLDSSAIVDNTNHWSGGHVSVDPQHVAGIFFSNRPLQRPETSGLIDIGPTMLARYGLDPSTTDMDGHVVPLQGVKDQ